MATVNSFAHVRDQFRLHECTHPVWESTFDESQRMEQMEDDLFAARSVCGVLITIVTGGAMLGIVAVLLAMLV